MRKGVYGGEMECYSKGIYASGQYYSLLCDLLSAFCDVSLTTSLTKVSSNH